MPRTYKPRPCRRCGSVKDAGSGHRWYCSSCAHEACREYFAKNIPWWCGACESPYYCVTCARIKRERFLASCALRKQRSKSSYFRPVNAERWWQQRCHSAVQAAVKKGFLPDLKSSEYACMDCGAPALEYDHRDYGRPFDVEPVCRSCNKRRGTAIWPSSGRFQFAKVTAHATSGAVTRYDLRPDVFGPAPAPSDRVSERKGRRRAA